jgi:hypothetical protein
MINYNISDRINQEIKEIINSYNSYREDKLKGTVEILWAEPGIKYIFKTNLGLMSSVKLEGKWSINKN